MVIIFQNSSKFVIFIVVLVILQNIVFKILFANANVLTDRACLCSLWRTYTQSCLGETIPLSFRFYGVWRTLKLMRRNNIHGGNFPRRTKRTFRLLKNHYQPRDRYLCRERFNNSLFSTFTSSHTKISMNNSEKSYHIKRKNIFILCWKDIIDKKCIEDKENFLLLFK
jgi:hypothetical protein